MDTFPSLFDLDLRHLPKTAIREQLKNREQETQEQGFDTTEEYARNYNLISFLNWKLQAKEKAWKYNELVLKVSPDNIIAITSRRRMFLDEKNQREADLLSVQLSELGDRFPSTSETWSYPVMVAKAEQAFCYGTLDSECKAKAVEMYREICQQPGRQSDIAMWKYDMALALTRQAQLRRNKRGVEVEDVLLIQKEATYMLACVALKESNQHRLRARAWIELAWTSNDFEYDPVQRRAALAEDIWKYTTDEMFQKGLELSEDDSYVLYKAAMFYKRNNREFCVELLKRSLKIHETRIAHDQMARVLIEIEKSKLSSVNSGKWKYFPDDEQAEEILMHFKKGLEQTQDCTSMHTMAYFLKEIGRVKGAIDILKNAIKSSGRLEYSRINILAMLLNTLGLFYKALGDQEDTRGCNEAAYVCFRDSIEVSAVLAKGSCRDIPSMFKDVTKKEVNKGLHFLTKRIKKAKYSTPPQFNLDCRYMSDGHEVAVEVERHLKANAFDDAALLINLLNCTEQTMDDELFLRCQLSGAIAAWKSGKITLSQVRIKQALHFQRRINTMVPVSDIVGDHIEDAYDVFVIADRAASANPDIRAFTSSLYNCLVDQCRAKVLSLIEDFDDEVVDMGYIYERYIRRSVSIVIIVASNSPSPVYQTCIDKLLSAVEEGRPTHSIMTVSVDDVQVPDSLSTFPQEKVYTRNQGTDHNPLVTSKHMSYSSQTADDAGPSHWDRYFPTERSVVAYDSAVGIPRSPTMLRWTVRLLARLMNIQLEQ